MIRRLIDAIILLCCTFPTMLAFVPRISASRAALLRPSAAPHQRSSVRCFAMKVTIRIVGRKKGAETWQEDACDMYLTRLKPSGLDVQTEWHKDNSALTKNVQSDYDKNLPVILLDPTGAQYTSEKLSQNMYRWIENGGSRMTFVIGGAEGLPAELKTEPNSILMSLSALTFTHQFARLVLIEQIYRASEIRKGSSYHK